MTTNSIKAEILSYFASLIEKETGIVYAAANLHLLEGRLRDLAKLRNFVDVDSMWIEVQKRGLLPVEREMVLDIATNNETSFFRDPEVFDFFRNQFIAQDMALLSRVRIWCAATSTGQEPYSLAMIMAQLRDSGSAKGFEIFATDISDRVLQHAKRGIYSQLEVQRGLSPQLLQRYFESVSLEGSMLNNFRIKPELAQAIRFQKLNLLDPWPLIGTFHIIFCRNVLIYQSIENKKKVIARMADLLEPGGYLVLGGAESLIGLTNDFEMKIHGKACVYQLKPRSQVKISA